MPSTVSKVEQCKDDLLLTSLQPSVVPMATGAIINLMFFSESVARAHGTRHTRLRAGPALASAQCE